MVINRSSLKDFEDARWKPIPNELKQYLLITYSQEPFPYVYSVQDLYENIRKDIAEYHSGKLDIAVKSPADRWREEREHLKTLYIEKAYEARELADYVEELERILMEHNIESSRIVEKKNEFALSF